MEGKNMAILQVKDLTKAYGKGDTTVTALGGVSFSVEKGEFVAIVGASGSGKSTLMHLIGGVDRPTSGSVTVDGQEIFKMNESELAIFRRRNIGLIYQFYNLIPTLTAEENIMLPRLLDNRRPDEAKLAAIFETTGLSDRAKHLPNELSGGQQQRVSIGRALINDPAIILADEPTGNLDSKSSREIIDLLKRSNKKYSQTLLIITHDENIALQADRVITISDGKILRDEGVRQ
jgi:putative ABC transport system ATP-binding protein